MKSVPLSPQAQKQAQALWLQQQQAQLAFQQFIKGCMAQAKLEGNWNMDVATWTFTEVADDVAD